MRSLRAQERPDALDEALRRELTEHVREVERVPQQPQVSPQKLQHALAPVVDGEHQAEGLGLRGVALLHLGELRDRWCSQSDS